MDAEWRKIYDAYTYVIKYAIKNLNRSAGCTEGEIIAYMVEVVDRHIDDLCEKNEIVKAGDMYKVADVSTKTHARAGEKDVEGSNVVGKDQLGRSNQGLAASDGRKRQREWPWKEEKVGIGCSKLEPKQVKQQNKKRLKRAGESWAAAEAVNQRIQQNG